MQIESALRQFRQERRQVLVPVGALALLLALLLFESARQTAHFVIWNLLEVAPLVVPGIVVAGWVSASGAGGMIAGRLKGGQLAMIVVASAAGAVTPGLWCHCIASHGNVARIRNTIGACDGILVVISDN